MDNFKSFITEQKDEKYRILVVSSGALRSPKKKVAPKFHTAKRFEEEAKKAGHEIYILQVETAYINFENGIYKIYNKDDKEGFIEYLDIDETAHSMIAMFPTDLNKKKEGISLIPRYTHCEIHPSLMFGILGANIPFANHNQAPRNTYQCIWIEEELLMDDGTYKKMKDIKVGDKVITFDLKEITTSPTKVVATILPKEPVEVDEPLMVPVNSNPLLKLPLI